MTCRLCSRATMLFRLFGRLVYDCAHQARFPQVLLLLDYACKVLLHIMDLREEEVIGPQNSGGPQLQLVPSSWVGIATKSETREWVGDSRMGPGVGIAPPFGPENQRSPCLLVKAPPPFGPENREESLEKASPPLGPKNREESDLQCPPCPLRSSAPTTPPGQPRLKVKPKPPMLNFPEW